MPMGNSSKIVLTNWLKHKFIGVTLTSIVEKLRTIKKSINLRLKQDFELEKWEKSRGRTAHGQFLQDTEPYHMLLYIYCSK